jgi:ABC-2 type transport system ATP-binding protein
VIVAVERLTHRYGERVALSDLSLHTNRREMIGLLGPNGSGKSTLFQILATLISPQDGEVEVAGFSVRRYPEAVRQRIGVVFQQASVDRQLTVEENLACQGALYGLDGAVLHQRVNALLEQFRLTDRRADRCGTLSGGLRRRVEIAKALLHEPQVLLLDEPSTGLDPAARRDLFVALEALRSRKDLTVLLTTHLLDEAERCDRLVLLHAGRRVDEGTPAELKAKLAGDVIAFESDDPAALAAGLDERFSLAPQVLANEVRIEHDAPHRFVATAVEAFPGMIQGVAFHKPTLEDVFLARTGARLDA